MNEPDWNGIMHQALARQSPASVLESLVEQMHEQLKQLQRYQVPEQCATINAALGILHAIRMETRLAGITKEQRDVLLYDQPGGTA